MPRPDGAVDIHAPTGHTGVRIQGGNFEIDKLKREIRLFGENAHTFLEIEFHHSPEPERDPSGPDPNGENQQQQFIFPFSDEKSRELSFLVTEFESLIKAKLTQNLNQDQFKNLARK